MRQLYFLLLSLFFVIQIQAQDYTTLHVTSGFNVDIIAENSPASTYTTASVDAASNGANTALMSVTYPNATVGLPANGLITSIATSTPGLTFQLAPYIQNNSLKINDNNGTGTLVIQTTNKLSKLFILATSGSGISNFTGTITFTDGTTQTLGSQMVPDWYNYGTPEVAIRGIGRVPLFGAQNPDNNMFDPKLFQIAIDIDPLNQNKIIQEVAITKTNPASSFLHIFALSGEITQTCFKPLNITVQTITKNSAQLLWHAPTQGNLPALGYKIEVRTSGQPGDATGLVQTLNTTNLSETIIGLNSETEYLIYVQSLCATTDESTWSGISFTTLCNLLEYELTTSASDLSFCDSHEVTLEVNTQGIVNWYNSATSTTPIHSGNTYTTTVSATSSFWYQVSSLESTGPLNAAAVSTTSGNWSTEWDVYFTIFEPTKLKSIDIYPSTAGQTGRMIFKQRGATGSATVGTIDYTTVGANRTVKQVVPIDLQLLPGTYVIETTLPSDGILRNTNGASYPYSSAVASITGNEYLPSYYMGYYNWIFETGCTSPRTEVVVTINETHAPTSTSQTFCTGATIASLTATGSNIKWYNAATGGTPLASTTVLTSGTYYVSQTLNACESNRTAVVVTINNTPAPTASAQTFCFAENKTIADLVATGTNLKWYDEATGGNALASTTVLTSKSYFVSQTVSNCESERTEVIVTITSNPNAPTAVAQTFCFAENKTIGDLVAIGSNIKWYDAATGGNVLNATTVLTSKTYFVSQTVSNCESERTEVIVTITPNPVAPTATAATFCFAENKTIADLVATGTNLKWYDVATGGNVLDATTVLTSKSYFVSQTVSNCESERTEVIVTITPNPNAPTSTAQTFCFAENKTIADLVVTGIDVKWYDVATGGNALVPTTMLATKSYFVSQTVSNCESERTEVIVTITPNPMAPTATAQTFCFAENKTIGDLVAIGSNIKWYDVATGGTALTPTTVLTTGSYFVSQTVSNCESERTEVVVTITPNPMAPTAIAQTFCFAENKTIADLVATGTNLKWYDVATGGNALPSTTVLTTKSYFVSQTVSNCESERTEVIVTITPNPIAPTANAIQEFCSNTNSKISNIEISGSNIKWYASINSTTELNENTYLTNASTYFATQTINGCESELRTQVTVQISTPPTLPTGDSIQTFCGNATIADLQINAITGAELIWYTTSYSNTVLPTSTALANATYYVAQKVGACISERKAVTARIINLSPPNIGNFEFCGSAQVSDLYIPTPTGVTYKWYNSPSNPNELQPYDSLTTGTYFVSKSQYNCETARAAVSVVIKDLPESPTGISPQSFVEGSVINQILINPTTAVWYITENDAITSTNPLSPNMPLVNGTTYYAVNIGTNGCPSLPFAVTVDVYLSNDAFEMDKLKYYPNPVNDKLNIVYFENIIQVDVFDLTGRNVKSVFTSSQNIEVDLSDLSTATYMIQLKTESKQQFIKIIKK
ncbi:T9SS type A sorting domain-containing protein [Flavobacterium sp. I3-2]|uniref:Ig-like domain-containing protein n=1 Tax=Flavobacterium sp. I3-2 TaxID=2748319 RepID=UPI0015B23381|nr:T9SS type A sorting domain-containing protein [Flavobacterium sp. I3-2]